MHDFAPQKVVVEHWLRAVFSQPIFSQPVVNQCSTKNENLFIKTNTYRSTTRWLTLVGCVKCPLVGWGGFLRTPHRNHSTKISTERR